MSNKGIHFLNINIMCKTLLSTATIEYSCPYVCLFVCLSVYTINSKNNGSIHLKFDYIVVYENSLDEFDIGHCLIKVKVTA